MPVTPLHVGVGLLGKGALPRRVSLLAFVVSQVLIDVEVAYDLFVDKSWPLHRWAHTFLGATAIGLAAGAATWVGGSWVVARLGDRWKVPQLHECRLQAAIVGGVIGGVTHPILDGLMHDDISPLLPFSTGNPFAGLVAYPTLALSLVAAGAVGLVLLVLRSGRRLPAAWMAPALCAALFASPDAPEAPETPQPRPATVKALEAPRLSQPRAATVQFPEPAGPRLLIMDRPYLLDIFSEYRPDPDLIPPPPKDHEA